MATKALSGALRTFGSVVGPESGDFNATNRNVGRFALLLL